MPKTENQPISNLIATAALNHFREQQFVDDIEMAEILDNEKLVMRCVRAPSRLVYAQGGSSSEYQIFETSDSPRAERSALVLSSGNAGPDR